MRSYTIGVDTGGTFTDFIVVEEATNSFSVHKEPTTPNNQAIGFISGIDALGIDARDIETIVHGTTSGTNAVLERRGVLVGLITTRGFRDVIELGRRTRPNAYGLTGSFEALVPRELRLEVAERISASGAILIPLDEGELRARIAELARRGAEALVIHFLHAHRNHVHEQRALEIARDLWPNKYVTASHRVMRGIREFERGTLAAINGYIQPIVHRYVAAVSEALRQRKMPNDLLLMQGNGGMVGLTALVDHCAHTLLSGPAAGAIAAAKTCTRAGFPNAITCDMGGTSFDVSLVRDGAPALTSESDIAYSIPIHIPMIDIHTIGSGGGSIVSVTEAGLIKVGPESAGSYPGPIGFGRGGTRVTMSDINFHLGRINARAVTGSKQGADLEAIRTAIDEQLARPLAMTVDAAAAAALRVANNQMANALRLVSIERGHDPRDFALFAFGGGGPLHAVALARELGIPTIIVPRFPGITSALGCVVADVRHDFVRFLGQPLATVDETEIDRLFAELADEGRRTIEHEKVSVTEVEAHHELDLMFSGQTHVFRIPATSPSFRKDAAEREFRRRYRDRFAIDLDGLEISAVCLRTAVIGKRRRSTVDFLATRSESAFERLAGSRRAFFDGQWLEAPVELRDAMQCGDRLEGPAIIEQMDTTVVLEFGAVAKVDADNNLIITFAQS